MTGIGPVSTVTSASAAQTPEQKQLKQAAHQFEALLTRQMLAEARKTNFGADLFSSNGIDTFREMMDSRFADVAADSDSLGLGKMIESTVSRLLHKAGDAISGGGT